MDALENIDLVIHTASFGMSGKDMLMKNMIKNINVDSTLFLIQSCIDKGVVGLVYTSSINVIFTGKHEMLNKDESEPYPNQDEYCDAYSASKNLAEQIVLNHNDSKLAIKNDKLGHDRLFTCSIRPAAIYGDGEERHFPRMIKIMKSGLWIFNIGKPTDKVDWVFIDNLVYAHILAAAKLLSYDLSERKLIGGQVCIK